MRIPPHALAFVSLVLLAQSAAAQTAAPPVPLSPAPVLGTGKDAQGRAMPFGVPPYYTPDTSLGSGPYKAVMATDPSLPEHVLYYPANIEAAGKLPIISWGNGACIHAGNRFRGFLTEIASHGFLVISAGRMGHVALEVGPQENPVIQPPGRAASAPAARSSAQPMILRPLARDALDRGPPEAGNRLGHCRKQQRRQQVLWPDRYGKVAVAGQSCGGGLSTEVAADPRVTALAILNAGTRLRRPAGPAQM